MAETSKQAVVRVEHLSEVVGPGTARVDALRDIDMDVYPGQVVGPTVESNFYHAAPLY